MKKLLTILVLALALCLVCSVAMAAERVALSGDAYKDAQQAVANMTDPATPINVTYKGAPLVLNPMHTSGPFTECLKAYELHFEGNYLGDTIFFDALWVKPHNINTAAVGTVIKDATCTANAVMSVVCPDCSQKVEYTYTGATWNYLKTGHTFSAGYTQWIDGVTYVDIQKITTAATCEAAGVWEYYCGNPGCSTKNPNKAAQVIDEVGHDFVYSWINEPTCVSTGKVTYTCRHCGIEWNAFLKSGSAAAQKITPFRKAEVAGILAHDYTVADALAETSLTWQQSKDVLNAKFQAWTNLTGKDYKGHDWDEFVPYTAATCWENSQWIRWCPVCGEKQILDNWDVKHEDDQLLPNYQIVAKVRDGDCFRVKVTFRCANCEGKVHPIYGYAEHPDIEVYMQDKMRLDKVPQNAALTWYDYELIGMDAKEVLSVDAHEYNVKDNTTKIGTFKPTCTEEGFTAWKCIYDATPVANFKDANSNLVVPAGAHPVSKTDIKDALGHKWIGGGEGWVMKYAPGEYDNVNGYWLRTCSVCGETENRISPYYPDKCEEGKHTYVQTSKTPATCLADGEMVETCSRCGDEKKTVIKTTGHAWDLAKVTTPATCTADGEGLFFCTACGITETQTIKALGHDYGPYVVTTEPTTEAEGEATSTCTRCGATQTKKVDKLQKEAEYTISDVKFEGGILSGKISHTEGTKDATVNVRVTFFTANSTYISVAATIYEDGTFEAEGAGAVEHIAYGAYAAAKVVNYNDVKTATCFGSDEFDVK